MIGIRTVFEAFFASEAGLAVYGLFIVALVDFALGTMAAFRDKTFTLEAVGAWLRKHIAGRVMPLTIMLLFGYFGDQPLLYAGAAVGATTYVSETIGSILASWGPKRNGEPRELQPVPTD